ncbi:efflux system protein [Salmonella enterica subsp. arizonae]|uniref:Efflux system protein n=1 Tax=Salmonella enterica subsp. arizonae TaxID=59203 RepID=A0A379SM04_SALER|nr:efflux system protein [Salmonella enterica subsp. arizonae]
MKGSNTFRWAIAIGVVVAAAAFWFWHSRSESLTAAPGVAAQAPHTAAGRRGMRYGPLAPVQAATATTQAVPRYLSGLGTVTAANTVTVRSRVGWSTHRPALSGRPAGQRRRSAGANRSQPV